MLITNPTEKVKREFKEKTVGYITAAFGLVAGLAWNDAVKALIEYLFPLKQDSVFAKFIYAIIMTLIVVIATMYITRLLKKNERK